MHSGVQDMSRGARSLSLSLCFLSDFPVVRACSQQRQLLRSVFRAVSGSLSLAVGHSVWVMFQDEVKEEQKNEEHGVQAPWRGVGHILSRMVDWGIDAKREAQEDELGPIVSFLAS